MKIARIYEQLTPAKKAAAEQSILGFLALDRAEAEAVKLSEQRHLINS